MMVEIGQRARGYESAATARLVDYTPATPDVPYECFTLADLRSRVDGAELNGLQRLHFDMVIACTSGSGVHEVDFEKVTIDRRRWLHIRPGQVHRWIDFGYEADLLLFAPWEPTAAWRPGPRIIELDDDRLHDIGPLIDLARHRRRGDVGAAVLHSLRDLLVRWLVLDRSEPGAREPLYADFRRLLDTDVAHVRSVEHFAARLNCSSRTLARACERAGASSPKTLIDEAVLLEAQRLLALPGVTITKTSATLGFDELTNFTKFFRRVGGVTPTAWQAERRVDLTGRCNDTSTTQPSG